jgi:hypothetical protein
MFLRRLVWLKSIENGSTFLSVKLALMTQTVTSAKWETRSVSVTKIVGAKSTII